MLNNDLNSHNCSSDIERILSEFNDTKADFNIDTTIMNLFEEQVVKNPNSIAVEFRDQKMTYDELNKKSNSLARELRNNCVQRQDIVGVFVERSFEMIIGIFAILKSGGAYLPIPTSTPEKRAIFMLENSGVKVVLTQSKFKNKNFYDGKVIDIEDFNLYKNDCSNLVNVNKSTDIAYIIFTSGSTGQPKGTMIEHCSLINRLLWMQSRYPIGKDDVLLQKTSFGFDVSVWEIFWWAISGAKVCMLEPGGERFPQAIISSVEKYHVSIIHFVPSMLHVFLNYIKDSEEIWRLSSLKRCFVSGESLTASIVDSFNKILCTNNCTKLTNLYGPTEATIDVSYYDFELNEKIETVPIGKPINNIRLYIVDNNKLQPIGKIGEIWIAGIGLARGYLNNDSLTKEKFVFSKLLNGERIYKTGDLGRWLPDGNIECLGRIDQQIKIRGFRIELEEIEKLIDSYNCDLKSSVVVKKYSETNISIIAFIVANQDFNMEDLKKYLRQVLPDYMIPSKFIIIDSFPLTNNGKLDKKLLVENSQ